jgi:hypothetical protein
MELDELMKTGIFLSVLKENWEKLGLTPLFLCKLLEHYWTYEEICFVLGHTVGPDFSEIKVGEWIDRLIAQGVKINDNAPFMELLDKLMYVYLDVHGDEMAGDRSTNNTTKEE